MGLGCLFSCLLLLMPLTPYPPIFIFFLGTLKQFVMPFKPQKKGWMKTGMSTTPPGPRSKRPLKGYLSLPNCSNSILRLPLTRIIYLKLWTFQVCLGRGRIQGLGRLGRGGSINILSVFKFLSQGGGAEIQPRAGNLIISIPLQVVLYYNIIVYHTTTGSICSVTGEHELP